MIPTLAFGRMAPRPSRSPQRGQSDKDRQEGLRRKVFLLFRSRSSQEPGSEVVRDRQTDDTTRSRAYAVPEPTDGREHRFLFNVDCELHENLMSIGALTDRGYEALGQFWLAVSCG